jgi:hypothetical protein
MTGNDSQSWDIRTLLMPQSGYRPVLPEEQSPFEFDSLMDAAIIMGQPNPYRPRPESLMGNPCSRVKFMDHNTTYDDAHVERQVSLDEGDDVDHGDDS